MSKPLEPKLPRWGHISFSATLARGGSLGGNPGFDSADEALMSICAFLAEVGQKEACEAAVTIRPAGSPRGEPPSRVVEVPCDISFGVMEDLRNCIRAELGAGSKAPSLKLVFRFDRTTHEG
jgi:hypothetical protein